MGQPASPNKTQTQPAYAEPTGLIALCARMLRSSDNDIRDRAYFIASILPGGTTVPVISKSTNIRLATDLVVFASLKGPAITR